MICRPTTMSMHSVDYAQREEIRDKPSHTTRIGAGRSLCNSQGSPTRLEGTAMDPLTTTTTRVNCTDTAKPRRQCSNTDRSYSPEGLAHESTWQPGTEPGIDPTKPSPPYGSKWGSSVPVDLQRQCEITVVDFSENKMRQYELSNDTLEQFLSREREQWVKCRWINVNGLSWDAIRILGAHKRLHRLAIEDVIHTSNRTKVDWYSGHTFIVLTLQKLVKLQQGRSDSEEEDEPEDSRGSKRIKNSVTGYEGSMTMKRANKLHIIWEALQHVLGFNCPPRPRQQYDNATDASSVHFGLGKRSLNQASQYEDTARATQATARSLQRYHGAPNADRIEFMERHAGLADKGLSVTLEQVSIFLHDDNTVTSFFESSADDIEIPILRRLASSETILRQSCDASMLLQAILDAVVDLAIPVTMAYQDAIGDLELEVLTDPDVGQSKKLYILTSEISLLRNSIQPVVTVFNALRDHRSQSIDYPGLGTMRKGLLDQDLVQTLNLKRLDGLGVTISTMCHTYLGDALDHLHSIVEEYDQLRRAADNMIDFIFNTINAYKNESMKQLSLVSCVFLPMGFLTAYFGMNFNKKEFPGIHHSDSYFWKIAVPFVVVTTLFLMRDKVQRYASILAQKRLIVRRKKHK